jgi:hypothetical protein
MITGWGLMGPVTASEDAEDEDDDGGDGNDFLIM